MRSQSLLRRDTAKDIQDRMNGQVLFLSLLRWNTAENIRERKRSEKRWKILPRHLPGMYPAFLLPLWCNTFIPLPYRKRQRRAQGCLIGISLASLEAASQSAREELLRDRIAVAYKRVISNTHPPDEVLLDRTLTKELPEIFSAMASEYEFIHAWALLERNEELLQKQYGPSPVRVQLATPSIRHSYAICTTESEQYTARTAGKLAADGRPRLALTLVHETHASPPRCSPSVTPTGTREDKGGASDRDSTPAWRVGSARGRYVAARPR